MPTDNCRVTKRERAQAAAHSLGADPDVLAVDVLDPDTDPTDRWTLDIVLRAQAGGVPTPVLYELAAAGATVRSVDRQGEGWQAIAVVGSGR